VFLASPSQSAKDMRTAWTSFTGALVNTMPELPELTHLDTQPLLQKRLTQHIHEDTKETLELSYARAGPGGGEAVGYKRKAFYRSDSLSSTWVTSFPSGDDKMEMHEAQEVAARYMGWVSPALAGHVGQPFGRSGQKVDAYGFNLSAAAGLDNGFTRGHNEFQDAIYQSLQTANVRCSLEPASLFSGAMSEVGRQRWLNAPEKERRGLIPDFLIHWHATTGQPAGVEIAELKTFSMCPSRYFDSDGNVRGAAAKRRVKAIHTGYRDIARRADMMYNGCGRKLFGPCRAAGCGCCDELLAIRQELRKYKLVGFAVGAYGEGSESIHALIKRLASAGTGAWKRKLPSASLHGTRGRLGWMIKRRLGMAALKLNARTLLDRIDLVGRGAQARNARRSARTTGHTRWNAEEARHEHGRATAYEGYAPGGAWSYFDGPAP
jgi:hypothetical protein